MSRRRLCLLRVALLVVTTWATLMKEVIVLAVDELGLGRGVEPMTSYWSVLLGAWTFTSALWIAVLAVTATVVGRALFGKGSLL